jgi:hypothetical protein
VNNKEQQKQNEQGFIPGPILWDQPTRKVKT